MATLQPDPVPPSFTFKRHCFGDSLTPFQVCRACGLLFYTASRNGMDTEARYWARGFSHARSRRIQGLYY